MKRYIVARGAKQDLVEIKEYLTERGGVAVARYVLREINAAMRFLSGMPGAGHVREDLTNAPVKFWSVFSYLIIYDPAKRPIEILRVIHGRRDVATILKQ